MSPPDPSPPDAPQPEPPRNASAGASAQPGLSRRRARSTAARPAPKRSRRRRELPEYATCEQCNEFHRVTLRVCRGGHILCANCVADADPTRPKRRCPICWRVAAFEKHHVASKGQLPDWTLPYCLNCHARLTEQQQRHWPPEWDTEPHRIRCIVQGAHDVVALWCEKHRRTFAQSREIVVMLGQAVLLVLACLCPSLKQLHALSDLHGVVGWRAA